MDDPTPAALASSGSTFLDRAVRAVAIVTLTYAALNIVQHAVHLALEGTSWWGYARGNLEPAARAVHLSRFGLFLLLLAGSIGMLKRKPWSRSAVLAWAPLHVIVVLAGGALSVLETARAFAAAAPTTQAAAFNPPLWKIALWQVFWVAESAILPLLVWLVLRQPEVAKSFEKPVKRGGFEVLPMAHPVEPEA